VLQSSARLLMPLQPKFPLLTVTLKLTRHLGSQQEPFFIKKTKPLPHDLPFIASLEQGAARGCAFHYSVPCWM
jgi:hypothetical protein